LSFNTYLSNLYL